MTERSDTKLRCSFCSTSIEDLQVLVTGPGVNICSSCVQACVQVMIKNHGFSLQFAQQPPDEIARRICKPVALHRRAHVL